MTDEISGALPDGEVLPDETPAEITADPAPAEQVDDKPKYDPVQRRIDRLTREKYEARAQAQMYEQRLQALEQQRQAPPPQAAPELSKFDNLQDYIDAKAAYVADQRFAEQFGRVQQSISHQQAAQQQAVMQQEFQTRLNDARKELPDFDDVIEEGDFVPSPAMAQAIQESDMGPKIAYHLAKHPDEAQRIARLSPTAAIRAIGRIEAALEANPIAKQTSQAPKPVEPVGGKASAGKDPDKMTTEEWMKWRNAQLSAKRRK